MAARRIIIRRVMRQKKFSQFHTTKFAGKTYTSTRTLRDKYAEDRALIIEGVPMAVRVGFAKTTFPAMVREMRELMDAMHNGRGTYPGFFKKRGEDSVYSSFQYTKVSGARSASSPMFFRNHSTHVNALIEGVKETRYTVVNDWVKSMARQGKLKSKRIVKRTGKGRKTTWNSPSKGRAGKKGWPEVISGVGATKYKIQATTQHRINKYTTKLNRLNSGPAFKGRTKKISSTKKHLIAANKQANRDTRGKKFSALVHGKSERNFWTPIVKKYFGRLPTLPPDTAVTVQSDTISGSVAVKQMTDSIYYRILKQSKKIKQKGK